MKKVMCTLIFMMLLAQLFAQDTSMILHFNHNSIVVKPIDEAYFVSAIIKNKYDSVVVIGHCDSTGNESYNLQLSKERADRVKQLAIKHGLKNKYIKLCVGKGEQDLISKEATENALQQNRRVEVLLTKNSITRKKELALVPKKKVKKEVKAEPLVQRAETDAVEATKEKLKNFTYKVGEKIVLENLQFFGSTHKLMPASVPIVKAMLDILKRKPTLEIAINGHVCCVVPDNYNFDGFDLESGTPDLSVQRALAIYNIFVNEGIKKERLSYKGFGATQKLFPLEENEQQKSLNRRVEFVIVKE